VGEEGVETALAGATKAPNLKDEAADLLYHLLVLLKAGGSSLDDVLKVLFDRSKAKK
jgi:phosphoribosyl-ATP pyrophosphohydrolase